MRKKFKDLAPETVFKLGAQKFIKRKGPPGANAESLKPRDWHLISPEAEVEILSRK